MSRVFYQFSFLYFKFGLGGKRNLKEMCEHFTRELAKIVVAQICNTAGFESIQVSALESLTDIMIKCKDFNLYLIKRLEVIRY